MEATQPTVAPVVDGSEVMAAVVGTDFADEAVVGRGHLERANPAIEHPLPAQDLQPRTMAGFMHIYGWTGIPMVAIFVLSAAWTIALAVIQQIPTSVANWLMGTTDLDDGKFWLLPNAGPELSIPATIVLVLFAVGYLGLAVLMAFPDKLPPWTWHHAGAHDEPPQVKHTDSPQLKPAEASLHPVVAETKIRPVGQRGDEPTAHKVGTGMQSVRNGNGRAKVLWERVRFEVTSPDGVLHHYYNPILDLPKLVFQTTTLLTYLHNGFPVVVIFIYSCALFINWLISSYRYKRERPDPHLIAGRIFYSFDLFFAVFAPLEVLVYAYYTFHFARDEFEARIETLSAGTFDRTARLFADPTQVSRFRIAFHYLQFTTVGTLLIKSALNLLSLFKWWRTIIHLVEHARSPPVARGSLTLGVVERTARAKIRRRKQLQNLFVAALFCCAGIAVFIHAIVAVVSTHGVCKPHIQCNVPSYQWNVKATHCSCIVFVDRDTQLKTVAEWENPPDTSANLAALAMTGHLRIIQIINRQVETIPEELRGCHNLEQLILLYTKTHAFPDWTKEFTRLEYLHVEGDLTPKPFAYMPRDLFANMPHLMFLHLGTMEKLLVVPDLDNLQRLEYLVLAQLHSVSELPSFASLHNLQRLYIIDATQVYSLPSVRALTKLNTFALTARDPVCCNGFITGTCDLTDFSCLNRTALGEPLVQCTTKRVDPVDYKVMTSTEGQVCERGLTIDRKAMIPTYASTDVACGGVMYKQCTLNGVSGICYPARFQPILCQMNAQFQAMRRLQIERGVGDPCDPSVEAWLGCVA